MQNLVYIYIYETTQNFVGGPKYSNIKIYGYPPSGIKFQYVSDMSDIPNLRTHVVMDIETLVSNLSAGSWPISNSLRNKFKRKLIELKQKNCHSYIWGYYIMKYDDGLYHISDVDEDDYCFLTGNPQDETEADEEYLEILQIL